MYYNTKQRPCQVVGYCVADLPREWWSVLGSNQSCPKAAEY